MISFLEYLKEYERKLKEDAVMAASASPAGAGAEVTSPATAAQNSAPAEVVSPTGDGAIPTTDNSVLGPSCKHKAKDCGFFGKGDFRIPQNVLSGEVQRRIELPKPRA